MMDYRGKYILQQNGRYKVELYENSFLRRTLENLLDEADAKAQEKMEMAEIVGEVDAKIKKLNGMREARQRKRNKKIQQRERLRGRRLKEKQEAEKAYVMIIIYLHTHTHIYITIYNNT